MKLLYFIIVSLLPILSFSQELFTVKEININEGLKSKQGKYLKLSDYVIRNSDATPDDLYHKTVLWFNENFKSDGNMILEDEKGKFIRIQGSTKELLKTHEVITSTIGYQGYRYILDIKFKYGRYKIEPVSLKTFTEDESLSEGWYERGFSNKILDADGEELVNGKNDMNTQLIFFNDLALNLDEFLNGNKITGEEEVW
tara:strand:+ start:8 stop:604 length:597 start_codon:yes stop_codon:yes gene_type:complete